VILFGIIGFGSVMWKWKILQLAFGRRVSLFLFHVWRKEPFGEGRTSIREAWELSGIGTKPPNR
jgi:hypothetical protein